MAAGTVARRHGNFKDITGHTFGRLTVIIYAGMGKHRGATWLCRCSCGAETVTRGVYLTCGYTRSCGCLRIETRQAKKLTHGDARTGAVTPEYLAWTSMIRRCENPGCASFKHYGGRGITVCECWREDYTAFLAHIGRRPSPDLSVDRINNDGNYEPGNVRWATRSEQRCNQRKPQLPRP